MLHTSCRRRSKFVAIGTLPPACFAFAFFFSDSVVKTPKDPPNPWAGQPVRLRRLVSSKMCEWAKEVGSRPASREPTQLERDRAYR